MRYPRIFASQNISAVSQKNIISNNLETRFSTVDLENRQW
jgi:hypothetical protein